jgi:hypothetical protein
MFQARSVFGVPRQAGGFVGFAGERFELGEVSSRVAVSG